MEAARNKVTEVAQFSRERQTGGGKRTPLDDCREVSVLGLKYALAESLEQVKLQLLEMVDKAMGLDLYHLYMDTLELVRGHGLEVEASLRTHYIQRFNLECRRDVRRTGNSPDVSELSLLAPDDLEESLAVNTLANAINNACSEELFALDKRMGMLINDPDLAHGDNPLGPEVIAQAVTAALADQGAAMRVRLLLVAQLSKHLPDRIKEVYRDLNLQLVKKNVLPTIRVGMRRPTAPAASPSTSFTRQGEPEGGGDLYALLQQMMNMGGHQAGMSMPVAFVPGPAMPGEPAAPGSTEAIQVGAFIHALNLLQRGRVNEVARAGLDAVALQAISQGGGQVNVLHSLRGMAGGMTPVDTMTLDIVAMVFDYVLEDKRIPDAVKALIGRLQIPVLKVAMLDRSFFSQKSHPARKLLDGLAEAAIGWDANEDRNGGLYKKIEQLVEYVLERFDDSIEPFVEALDQLNAYLAEERREAALAMVPSVQAVKGLERAEQARQVAHDEVQSSLLGHPVPVAIGTFLTGPWQRMLADIHQKAGEESAAWKGALGTMNDLVWSLAPKVNPEERKQLVAMLPGLLKRLDEGINYLGLAQSERDAFFTSLVKCHAEAVKPGLLDAGEQMSSRSAEAEDIPVLNELADFEPVEPVEESVAELPELVQELVAEADQPALEEITIGGLYWNGDELETPDAEPEMSRLKRGSWIEYLQDDGATVRAKLSWISPQKGMYLFTNRYGKRAISINAEGLQAKLRNGEVRILNDVPLMDRAVGSLMEHLQRHAA
jgi:hypothetical protein